MEIETRIEDMIVIFSKSMWTYIYFIVAFEKSPPMAGDGALRSMIFHLKSR